jgi:hypothetical protein
METLFYLAVLFILFVDLKDLLNIGSLLDKRFEYSETFQKFTEESQIEKSEAKNFIANTLIFDLYWIVMIIGLFTSYRYHFIALILITLISGKMSQKFETNRKLFTNYFVIDKTISIVILASILFSKYL